MAKKAEKIEKIVDTSNMDNLHILHSDEWHEYTRALSRLACVYISEIRVKFAERAFEKYADLSVRKLVLAYGKEVEALDKSRWRDFEHAAEWGASEYGIKDSCLSKAHEYATAIWFLFGIDDDKEEKK